MGANWFAKAGDGLKNHARFPMEDPRTFLLVLSLLGAGACFLWLKPSGMSAYWNAPLPLSTAERHRAAFLAIGALLLASTLNFFQNQIGYDADETLEFGLVGLPSYKQGWLWWSLYDEPLTHNINAFLCHLLGIQFMTFKVTAFFFRTGAGIFVWLLARELFGSRVALWSALILSTSVMFLCSMDAVIKELSVPFVFLGCLAFTFRGLRTGGLISLVLGGSLAGLVPYTYVTRLAMAAVLFVWPFLIWISHERTHSLLGRKSRVLWWLIPCCLFLAPFLFFFLWYPHSQIPSDHVRHQSSWHMGGLALVCKVAWTNFAGIFYRGDSWFTRNFKALPMLWWPWVLFFWIGLAAMACRIRETRMSLPLLLMAACVGLAGLSCLYVPNFKFVRVALILSVLPTAIGLDLIAVRFAQRQGRRFMLSPLLLASAAAVYGVIQWRDIPREPLSWWFRDVVQPREAFVHANPQFRYFGIGSWISDMRKQSVVTEVGSLRQVLETPGDGRDLLFLFPDGREEWQRKLIEFWTALYPGGRLTVHTRPIRGGDWPMFISYQIPSSSYWFLPPVPPQDTAPASRAATWWRRAEILSQHGLTMEAWRDALQAAHLNSMYYARADALLGNKRGREGRLSVLLRSQLWSEAREELSSLPKGARLSALETAWKAFLESHGLEVQFYSGYTAHPPPIASARQYMPQLHMGYYNAFARKRLHFSAVAKGQLLVPTAGRYRFQTLNPGCPVILRIDGTTILEVSRNRSDDVISQPVLLESGLHSLHAENCALFRFEGEPPIPSCVPDPMSYAYGFDPCWSLTWQFEDGLMRPVPPELIYASGAKPTVTPPLP